MILAQIGRGQIPGETGSSPVPPIIIAAKRYFRFTILETLFGRRQHLRELKADGAHLEAARAPQELDEQAADRFAVS